MVTVDASTIQPGEQRSFVVDPRERYNATGLRMEPGQRYLVNATGTWKDAGQACGPIGWGKPWMSKLARVPSALLFRLCGGFGQSEARLFPIPLSMPWEPLTGTKGSAAPLFLFANDLWFMYWNNRSVPSDPLQVEIKRLS